MSLKSEHRAEHRSGFLILLCFKGKYFLYISKNLTWKFVFLAIVAETHQNLFSLKVPFPENGPVGALITL